MGAKILSRNEIIERVKSGDIKISYYYLSSGNPIKGNHQVTCNPNLADNDDGQSDAWKLFLDNLEEDSLRLCVGPYALIEHRTYFRRLIDKLPHTSIQRKFFTRCDQDIFSLIDNSSTLHFYHNENVVIGTNENIKLGDRIGGALFATVKNTDVGLPHISTTIDPGWSGRLQIGLVNPTRTCKKLDFMESICKARFHEHKNPCSPQSVTKKPHGLGWEEIERDISIQFFPRRKETATKLEIRNFEIDQFLGYAGKLIALLATVGSFLLYWYFQLQSLDDRIKENDHNIKLIREGINLKAVDGDVKSVKEKITGLEKKVDHILPASNAKDSTLEHRVINAIISREGKIININFEREYHNRPYVLVAFDNADNYNTIKYEVQLAPQIKDDNIYYNSANIDITPKNLKRFKEQNLNLHVFIVP
ncbi:hypothetical protein [Methylobacter sp. YRD-M1]|uniref:hypothetical protein n=1 Tax=Methylobacter sp. YRD-M1 TaxID=2911520 RepID=UPI00227C0F54|nr:hypothetical protein [Methylobacter sp. YRD-M1]WAK01003.1 hypothetical protein LZ558_14305 [Methylobacter sp. YRD-M1]